MSKKLKKALSLIVAIMMIVSIVPIAFAEDTEDHIELVYSYDGFIRGDSVSDLEPEYGSEEYPDNLFDGNYETKLCVLDVDYSGFHGVCDSYFIVANTANAKRVAISGYKLVTGNDFPDRDPKSWTLYGSNDNSLWHIIDEVEDGKLPNERNTEAEFTLSENSASYEYFKLEVHDLKDNYEVFQLSELVLVAHDHVAGEASCGGHICTECGQWFGEDVSGHTYENGVCTVCAYKCVHNFNGDAVCDNCAFECLHPDAYYDCAGYHCDFCSLVYGEEGEHTDEYRLGICDVCGKFIGKEIKVGETITVELPDDYFTEAYVKFVPEHSGEYILISDGGGTRPSVTLFDENLKAINDPVYGHMYACGNYNKTDFKLEYTYTAGETYYFYLGNQTSLLGYDISLYYGSTFITHHPTASEPYVEVDDILTVEAYQWYCTEVTEITDENAECYEYAGETATYSKENGWSSIYDQDDFYSSATIQLHQGDMLIFEMADSGFEIISLWDYDASTLGGSVYEQDDKLSYELYVTKDGNFTVYFSTSVDHRIYLVASEKDLIENATEYKLSSPVIGNVYQCEVTLEDGTVITSDAFEYKYEISHQPTAAEPYVETNYDEGAAYQWFKENNNDVEITDENAFPRDNNDGGEFATYDEETGWTGISVYEGGNEYNLFTVELKAGDVVRIITDGPINSIGRWAENDYDHDEIYNPGSNVIDIKVKLDDEYNFYYYTQGDVKIRAYVLDRELIELEGEATDTLINPEDGKKYLCEVTFADGTTEISDSFVACVHEDADGDNICDKDCGYEYPVIDDGGNEGAGNEGEGNEGGEGGSEVMPSGDCNCICHHNNPLSRFIYKLIQMIRSLFGIYSECKCGIVHV